MDNWQNILRIDEYKNFGKKLSFKQKIFSVHYKFLLFYRITNHYINKSKKNKIERLFQSISNTFFKHYVLKLGNDIKAQTNIGKGLYIAHPIGIVITKKAEIGENCTIMQQVTIGLNSAKHCSTPPPIIGDNVYIGAGAKILGNIKIGNNVIIGANAVVVKDVEDNCIVAGVPAKIIKKL